MKYSIIEWNSFQTHFTKDKAPLGRKELIWIF